VAAADTDKRSSASPCGLAMDRSTKEVVKIQLCANNLSGPLSDSIGCITSLVQLNLSSNNLVGPLPAALGLLHHLESLCLDRNQLRGEIPRSLKNLQRLLILKLEFNELTGTLTDDPSSAIVDNRNRALLQAPSPPPSEDCPSCVDWTCRTTCWREASPRSSLSCRSCRNSFFVRTDSQDPFLLILVTCANSARCSFTRISYKDPSLRQSPS